MKHKENIIYSVPLKQIHTDANFNIRDIITPESCYELAKDINEKGLIYPVTLRERDKSESEADKKPYALVAGFRRFEAHKINKADRIKAIFSDVDEKQAFGINLSENINRENLSLKEEVEIINNLFKKGLRPTEIRKIVGKHLGWITNRICIARLPKEIKDRVYSGEISMSDAIDLGREYDPFIRTVTAERLLTLEIDRHRKYLKKRKGPNSRGVKKSFRLKKEVDLMLEFLKKKLGDDMVAFKILSWAFHRTSYTELEEYLKEKYPYIDWDGFPERPNK